MYVPSHVLSGLYYDKKRGIATGIATSGSGFGAIIFPLLVNALVENYGWKGSFYIVCGISMQNFVFASLLRPVPEKLLQRYKDAESERQKVADVKSKNRSSVELTAYSVKSEEIGGKVNEDFINAIKGEDINVKIQPQPLEEDSQTEIWEIESPHNNSQGVGNDTFEDIPEEILDEVASGEENEKEESKDNVVSESDSVSVPNSPAKLLQPEKSEKTIKVGSPNDNSEDKMSLNAVEQSSLAKKSTCQILCNYTFIIFFINNIFWNMGLVIILLFGPEYMTTVGLTEKQASLAFSIGGVGAVIGSIVGGFLGNIKKIRLDLLYIVIVICVGIIALLFPVSIFHTFFGMSALYFVFSIFANIIMGLLVIVVAAILGPDALGVGMGYAMLANGIGSVAAPPLIGMLLSLMNVEIIFIYSY